MARATTPDISLPPLAEQFVLNTIAKAIQEITDSTSVDLHTWRVANDALLQAMEAVAKDAALWTPVP